MEPDCSTKCDPIFASCGDIRSQMCHVTPKYGSCHQLPYLLRRAAGDFRLVQFIPNRVFELRVVESVMCRTVGLQLDFGPPFS